MATARLKHKPFNPNAAKNIYKLTDKQYADLREDRIKLKNLRKILFVDSPEFDHVSKNSVDSLKEIIKEKNQSKRYDTGDLFAVDATPIDRRKQNDVDNLIIEEFCENMNQANFTHIWKRFYPGVKSYALRLMGDEDRADDMCQETFQRAWEKRYSYKPENSRFVTWLYTICKNICITTLKKDSQTKAIDIDLNDMFNNTRYQDMVDHNLDCNTRYLVNDGNNGISLCTFDDIQKRMYEASLLEIAKMEPLFQQIISMKEVNDMTLAEIAKRLCLSESKVKNIYYKSKGSLSDRIIKNNRDLFVEYQAALIDKADSFEDAIYASLNIKPFIKNETDDSESGGSSDELNFYCCK